MRVFVTGATGFVGSHLVDALLARGDEVVCLVRNPTKAAKLFPDRPIHRVQGDLSNPAALRAGCQGADLIYHVAGATAAVNRRGFFAANLEGTKRLVEAASAGEGSLARFVYVSSQAAAGPNERGRPRTEADAAMPVSDYGRSKLAAEDAVRTSRLPWTVIRPTAIYGPRDTEFLRLFRLARLGVMPLVGSADQELSLVHVQDVVAALLAVAAPSAEARTYFACHEQIVTAGQLALACHAAVREETGRGRPRPTIVTVPAWATRAVLRVTGGLARLSGRATVLSADKANELLAPAWTCSPRALESETGWRAEIPLDAGAPQTARWYRAQGWL